MKHVAAFFSVALSCGQRAPATPSIEFQIVGESTRWRAGDTVPPTSAFFDGQTIAVPMARGEMMTWQFLGAGAKGPVKVELALPTNVARLRSVEVVRPSTSLFGPSRGRGHYFDALGDEGDITTIDVRIPADQAVGRVTGVVTIGARTIPITIDVVPLTLPAPDESAWLWGYYDRREINKDDAKEAQCQALFRAHGVVASPELTIESWPARKASVRGLPVVPVLLPTDDTLPTHVRQWVELGRSAGQVPFAIPVDEPRDDGARAEVVRLATLARQGGSGEGAFLYAVTAQQRPEFAGLVDVYLTAAEVTREAQGRRWTYNGTPPQAGAMVVDAGGVDLRTWGWIAARWDVELWYIWDVLYWHDRHNRRRLKLPPMDGPPLAQIGSFDDGEDVGNLDGVLAYPDEAGCGGSLRLRTLRRGVQDRQLLRHAKACDAQATDALMARMVPRALGDSQRKAAAAWPSDEGAWEAARREALAIAARCPN